MTRMASISAPGLPIEWKQSVTGFVSPHPGAGGYERTVAGKRLIRMPISLVQSKAVRPSVAFIDLAAQQARLKPQIDAAIARVLADT